MEKLIHNVSTNDVNLVPFNDEDYEQIKLMAEQDQEMANAISRRNVAKAKLEALGLDEDDLEALGF